MRQKILLVDGDQTISETVNAMLKGAGHETRIETSGGDGLEAFSRNPRAFNLIILDVGLPDISGLLLAEKLLKVRSDIPIVLLSGEEGQTQSKARNSGINFFGSKPLSMTDLAETVQRALTGA